MILSPDTVLDEASLAAHDMSDREAALHTHYASNALALGHAPSCEKVTLPRNWPRMGYRPLCSCGQES